MEVMISEKLVKESIWVVVGSGGVGKSAISIQFVVGKFVTKYNPTIEDSYRKQIEIDDLIFQLEILDTAGTQQFALMRDLYLMNADGYVLVYAINSKSTFQEISEVYDQIVSVKGIAPQQRLPAILVGNKSDLHESRKVSFEDGEKLAKRLNCDFIEASAKDNVNINEIFNNLVTKLYYTFPQNKDKPNNIRPRDKKNCIVM